jgi:nucleotide-binding universal stress UspA family protein
VRSADADIRPVQAVSPEKGEREMLPKINTILYATGLGAGAPYVFRYALSLARKYDARIWIVHGREPLSATAQSMADLYMYKETAAEVFERASREAEEKIRKNLEELCSQELCDDPQGRRRVDDIVVAKLPPKQAILEEAAKCGADLIVMGSHRHSVLADAMLGTTTLKVLHSTTVPVLVVKIPEGYHEETS